VTIGTIVFVVTMAVSASFALPPREYGWEKYRPRADCPREPCRATGRTTGFQVRQQKTRGGEVRMMPTKARRRNGWLVAFSLTLGKPNKKQIRFFNRLWGGPAQVRVTILDPKPRKPGSRRRHKWRFRVHNQSRPINITSFFGKKAWFTLKQRMHVERRHVIALTIPTWAPVLATDLPGKERWRSSRPKGRCNKLRNHTARQEVGKIRYWRCLHSTARLLFTGLVVRKTPEAKSR